MSGNVLIDIIAGARPNFMKIAPIIKALECRKAQGGALPTAWSTRVSTTTRACPATFSSSLAFQSRM